MTTSIYKNILLIGATGNVGKPALSELLADSSFNVTVLTRANSKATFPSNVKVIQVDYSDTAALTKALTGQDVVVSTIGGEGVATNFGEILVQAAIDANVKWLIPSDFGIDIEEPSANIPHLTAKLAVGELLRKNQSRISHTFITTGTFLDWGFDNGWLGFDINNRTVTLFDEGKYHTSGTTLSTVGKAIVAVIRNPKLTLNKRIYVADATYTQQQALSLFEKYTNTKWSVKNVTTKDTRKGAEEAWAKGDIEHSFGGYILSHIHNASEANNFESKTINKELGLPTVSLDQIVKEVVARKNNA